MDRNYATATLCICCRRPLSVCLSVCPSQAGVVSKRPDESSWFLECRPPSAYPTLSYKELWVSPKTKVLPSGTLSQTPDLEDFATASRSRCRQNSSSSSSTVELVDDTYTTVDKSRSTAMQPSLTPLLRFVVQLVSTVDKCSRLAWRVARSDSGSRVSC